MHRLGNFDLYTVSDGFFWLDGGAMFGVVPRVLWEKLMPPDERNRIRLSLNCLLIRTGNQNVLVETGVGRKYDAKQIDMYRLEPTPTLTQSLERVGLGVKDIDVVVLTHLHFDHAGGCTQRDSVGKVTPMFPNARYVAQKVSWEEATRPDERTRASYIPHDFMPLQESGQLQLVDGDQTIVEGVSVHVTGGHTRGHQAILIESKGQKAVYFGCLIPTTNHLKLPYIMGYDLFPQETLRAKKDLIGRAVREHWLCAWVHDPNVTMGYVREDSKGFTVEAVEKVGV